MMSEKTRKSLYNKVDKIVGKFALKDWERVNIKNSKMKYKKSHPYTLSHDTNEAREILHLLYKKASNITLAEEAEIKCYLRKANINNWVK